MPTEPLGQSQWGLLPHIPSQADFSLQQSAVGIPLQNHKWVLPLHSLITSGYTVHPDLLQPYTPGVADVIGHVTHTVQ